MLIALWIVNALVALSFVVLGAMKLFRAREALIAAGMTWIEDFPMPVVRLIGLAEILGAIGVILPLLLGIAPVLTPIAAVALTVLLIGAAVVHLRRGEPVVVPLVSAVLTVASAVLGFLVVLG